MWVIFLEIFPIQKIKIFWNPLEKTLYTFCFHESQEGTVVIVMPSVSSYLSYWKRNVPIKCTRRHTGLLTELGLFGSFVSIDSATIRFQIFEEFKDILELGRYFLIFFLGSWGFGDSYCIPLPLSPPTPTWGEKAGGLDEASELLACWGLGPPGQVQEVREKTRPRQNLAHRITPEWIL